MISKINISLNPTYLCNLRCEFCYLSKEQLGNPQTITLEELFARLSEISSHRQISEFDIYGGEIAMIPDSQMISILDTAKLFYPGQFNIISNFTNVPDYFYRDDLIISVSWDYFVRAKNEQVYKNMLNFNRPLHILMLATDELLKLNKEEVQVIIKLLNAIPSLRTFEIKPYSSSKHNIYENNFRGYENWVQWWIDLREEMSFQFVNLDKIALAHQKQTSSWSDDHLYIKPNGQFAVLDFDSKGEEFFQQISSFEDYLDWCEDEKKKFKQDETCGNCKYLGHCLSEHMQLVSVDKQSCSGFYNLLENNRDLINEFN